MNAGKLMTGQDERVPVLFVGPDGCRIAPRNSALQDGEVFVDHGGLELHVNPMKVVKATVKVYITDVESLGPDVLTELYTTWQGKKYKLTEVDND